MRFLLFLLFVSLVLVDVSAQGHDLSFLKTRAEATIFAETTRYDEVMAFTEVVANASDRLVRSTFGYTAEGRALPLVVYSTLDEVTPETVRASGKTRVLVLANIHAGEVAGKEAMLMLLRALAAGQHRAWLDSLVVLIAPIYNADGNERIHLTNRPLQLGPVGGMGQRTNVAGLDLNRDFMKTDAPETRSLLKLLHDYDPHVLIDLHTTNGSYHGYHLTYAPPLHPNTPPAIDSLLREEWLPEVTETIKERYGWDYYYYGNVPPPTMDATRGWYTFDHRPRFGTNYAGLRNRIGILSEAYSYAPFEERVLASLYFVEELLDFAHQHASRIREFTAAADREALAGRELPVRATYDFANAPVEAVLMGVVEEVPHPFTGETMLKRTAQQTPELMPVFGTFVGTETEVVPAAYLIPDTLQSVIDRLGAHGIRYERLAAEEQLPVETYHIDSTHVATRVYQGHQGVTVFGRYEAQTETVPAGTIRVDTAQPLGRLAFLLLEPRSDDGLLQWGLVPLAADLYPIRRITK